MTRKKFHSFDAFRFIAFLKVFLLHLPVASGVFPLFEKLKGGGEVGVLFFFVLSGFLITYLLLLEKLQIGRVRLKNFFIKRTLRIWPVFFLTVGLVYALPNVWLAKAGFFTVNGYEPEWSYSFTFLENYRMIMESLPPRIETLWVNWTICVEQHFYILWPFIILIIPVVRLPMVMVLLVLSANFSRYFSVVYFPDLPANLRFNDILTNMDFLALGGLTAWLVMFRSEWLEGIVECVSMRTKWAFIVLVVASVLLSGFLPDSDDARLFTYPLYGLLFAALLLLFTSGGSPVRIKDSSWLSFLGRISYGLYMYHLFVILVVAKFLQAYSLIPDTTLELLVYIIFTLCLCIVVSWASWKWFEMPFLQAKRKLVL